MKLEKAWYKPREIARMGVIVNSVGNNSESSNYHYIVKLIRTRRLQAKEVGMGAKARPVYLVSRDELQRYIDEWV
jgi:hypothetical protein